ncbi:MAG: acyl-CoA dehydrogenase [Candidatus Marinimicrobia bacterium]|nr:acyl-CoA dehydrogenase [Candidatus Neomarinimicrobiota bacterium]
MTTFSEIYKIADPNGEMTSIDLKSLNGVGGSFLTVQVDEGRVFAREQFSEEHKMFAQAAVEFGESRIKPNREALNVLNKSLSLEIFKEMGELGFLAIDVPEDYEGLGLDKTTACLVVESLSSGRNASILVTMSAHTGIALLPIIWYGSEKQKKKYLPKMGSGEWMGAYALTEPGAGSDALSGKMTAELNESGSHYILNGTKIYITNGAWADIVVTFAKTGINEYTSFIVEKDFPGFIVGAEENKMGIKGSSTVTLFFENCEVPVENVIGKIGQGGAIAFNVLYVGRYKLGVVTAGGAKYAIESAYEFGKEREQFNRPITEFGMIQKKFANMVINAWEADCLNYMTSGSIDNQLDTLDRNSSDYFDRVQSAIEDHGIEASICKIVGSETLQKTTDEALQIFGGAGFIEEYPFAAMYRDERINRIYEGTNEINRMIIGGYTLKKAINEEIPIRNMILKRKVQWNPELNINKNSKVLMEAKVTEYSRSLLLMILDDLILTEGQDLKSEQWILEPLANMVIAFSIMDTGVKRYLQLKPNTKLNMEMLEVLKVSIAEKSKELNAIAEDIWSYIYKEDVAKEKVSIAKQYYLKLNYNPNIISGKKKIMDKVNQYGKYYLDKEEI